MSLSLEEGAEKALKLHKVSVVRLQDELDQLIKIFSHMRESFQNEMMDGAGFKKMGLSDNILRQGDTLSRMMTNVVNAKVRFDKAAKQMADLMTPEEERAAVTKYVQAMSSEERVGWMDNMHKWMARRNEIQRGYDASDKPA